MSTAANAPDPLHKNTYVAMKTRTPYLKKSCNRFSLRVGSLVVGWYSLVTSVFGILRGFYSLGDISRRSQHPEVAADLTKLKLIFSLLDVVFSILFLIGLYRKSPEHYLAWLIAKSALLLCEIPLYIVMSNFDKLCDELGVFLLFMGVDVYCLLVVHGYFMEVTNPEILKNPEESEV